MPWEGECPASTMRTSTHQPLRYPGSHEVHRAAYRLMGFGGGVPHTAAAPFGIITGMLTATGVLMYGVNLLQYGKPKAVAPDNFDRMLSVRDKALVTKLRSEGKMGPEPSLMSKIFGLETKKA
jgi:hypothetical protein